MFRSRDLGTGKSKLPAEDSHAANTSTLRNIFAKSAKLEAFDVLDTLGAPTPLLHGSAGSLVRDVRASPHIDVR